MEKVQFVLRHWPELINALTAIISACAAIAALTPTRADDAVVAKLRKLIDLLAMNWGHAKNRKAK